MYKHILVAIDGSETSEHAFDAALQLAHESGAQLQPLYVVDNPLMAYDAFGYDPTRPAINGGRPGPHETRKRGRRAANG
jgi:nucleotide-binding universal stress UspA family protein